tara:strand:+ start:1198 stop:1365 length:168 start_codon:yes stop_codon:yes gene_type:complete
MTYVLKFDVTSFIYTIAEKTTISSVKAIGYSLKNKIRHLNNPNVKPTFVESKLVI